MTQNPNGHTLYETGDPDAPSCIKDQHGDVVLALCKVCGRAEIELNLKCDSAARSIIARRRTIKAEQDAADQKMRDLQEECKHKNAKREAQGSSGNYDPSADSYWYRFECPDCGKVWTTPQ